MILRPELLLHPNIPKPLHGLNPRTIKGQAWWDVQRRQAYKEKDYHCWACGVHKSDALYHQWLEGHEYYEYDYVKGLAKLKYVVALCHCCHNFIHSGKTEKDFLSHRISFERFKTILQHGTDILFKNNLPMNIFAYSVIRRRNLTIQNIPNTIQTLQRGITADWEDWRLEIDDVMYKPLYSSFEEWKKKYN